MDKRNLFLVVIGIIAILLSSYAFITNNADILLIVEVKFIIGFIVGIMLIHGVLAFREKRKVLGLFYIFVTLIMFTVLLLNNSINMNGILLYSFLCLVLGLPIVMIVTIVNHINTKK